MNNQVLTKDNAFLSHEKKVKPIYIEKKILKYFEDRIKGKYPKKEVDKQDEKCNNKSSKKRGQNDTSRIL